MARGGTAYGADGTITIGTSVDMYGMNTGLKKIQKSITKLKFALGAALGLGGTLGLGALSKAALTAASDLQEVQNIVDVSFGEMSDMVEKFASTSVEKFGMSELAAKQTAGSFMAMGKALGISMEDAAKMSISLTALTGDMSSFYNISQDYARVALSAVYTGETETLKRYGIVLTEANLQEYASTLGIKTKVKAMDASTKAMLRYKYILEATKDITGDFVRTQDTWANQVRVLQQRWNQLLITMGSGLITIFTPMIKALNTLIERTIYFANVLGAVLGKIFGIKWQNLTEQMGQLSNAEADVSGGLDDAGDAAEDAGKKVKKTLAPWDELTDLMKTTADSGEDVALKFEMPDIGSLIGDFGGKLSDFKFPDIRHLFSLGRKLSEMLAEWLSDIDWSVIKEKAHRIGEQIADFLNGAINPRIFSEIGKTIAEGLNTIVELINGFAARFNWVGLGDSIAAGINSFFSTFDFSRAASTINIFFSGLLDMMLKVVERTNWSLIGKKIGKFLLDIDWSKLLKKSIKVVTKLFTGIAEVFKEAFEVAPVETFVAALLGLRKILKIPFINTFVSEFSSAIGVFELFGRAIRLSDDDFQTFTRNLNGSHNLIASIMSGIREFSNNGGSLFQNLGAGLEAFRRNLSLTTQLLGGLAVGFSEFFILKNVFSDLFNNFQELNGSTEEFTVALLELAGTVSVAAAAFSLLFGVPAGIIMAGVVAAIAGISELIDTMNEIDANAIEVAFGNVVANVGEVSHTLDDYLIVFDNFTSRVTNGIDEINQSYSNLENARNEVKQTTDIIGTIALAMQSQRTLTEGEIDLLKSAFDELNDKLKECVDVYYDTIIQQTMADYAYLVSVKGYSKELEDEYANRIQGLYEAKALAEGKAGEATKEAAEAVEKYMQVSGDANATTEDIVNAQNELHDACVGVLHISTELTGQTSEMDKAVSDAKKSFDDLQGSLKLSDYGVDQTKNAVAEISSAVSQLEDDYDKAYGTLKTNLDNIDAELEAYEKGVKTAHGNEVEELKQQRDLVELRMSELNKAYADGLSGIQKDIIAFAPQMVSELEQQWDQKADWWKFLHPKDSWIKSEMQTWVGNLYGDEGLKGELNKAWGKLSKEGAPDAQAAANELLTNFFKVDKGVSDTLVDNWRFYGNSIAEGALAGIDEKAGDIVDKVNAPFDEAAKRIEETYGIHSPSTVYEGYGSDLMQGAINGVNSKGDEFVNAVSTIVDNGTREFSKLETNNSVLGKFNAMIDAMVTKVEKGSTEIFNDIVDTTHRIITNFTELFTGASNKFNDFNYAFKNELQTLASDFSSNFISRITSIIDTFVNSNVSDASDTFTLLWRNAAEEVVNLFETLGASISTIINSAIDGIINTVVDGINDILDKVEDALNSILNIGNAISNLPSMPDFNFESYNIPGLAKGAVIPPNKQFLAMLGDQKSGTNIEAPLDTIKQAMAETLSSINFNGGNQGDIVVQIDGYEVFRAVRNQSELFRNSTGYGVL